MSDSSSRHIIPASAASASVSSYLLNEKERQVLEPILIEACSAILDLESFSSAVEDLKVKLHQLHEAVMLEIPTRMAVYALRDSIVTVLGSGDLIKARAFAGEGQVKKKLRSRLSELHDFASRLQTQHDDEPAPQGAREGSFLSATAPSSYPRAESAAIMGEERSVSGAQVPQVVFLLQERERDGQSALELEIGPPTSESREPKAVICSVFLKKHVAPSDTRQRVSRAARQWIVKNRPDLTTQWQALSAIKRELDSYTGSIVYDPKSKSSYKENGYSSLKMTLEHSIMSAIILEEAEGVKPAFALCMSERDGVSEINEIRLLSSSASRRIADWLQTLLPILDREVLPLLVEDDNSEFGPVKGHLGKWKAGQVEGDAARRLASCDLSVNMSTVHDYETLKALVEEMKENQWCQRFHRLLNYFERKGKLNNSDNTGIQTHLKKSLKDWHGVQLPGSTAGISISLAGFQDPAAGPGDTDSFWALKCSGSLRTNSRAKLPRDIATSVVYSDWDFALFSDYGRRDYQAQDAIKRSLSFYQEVYADGQSLPPSLASQAEHFHLQVSSKELFPDMEDVRRRYVCSLLAAVQSTLKSGSTGTIPAAAGGLGAANSLI